MRFMHGPQPKRLVSLQDQDTDTQKEMYEAQGEGSTGDASGGSSLLTPCHLAFSLQTAGRSLVKVTGWVVLCRGGWSKLLNYPPTQLQNINRRS